VNIAHLLEQAARRWPEVAAVELDGAGCDYATFAARVAALAEGLRRRGVAPGDRVLLLQRNRPELLESLWACFWGGFVAVPLNARLAAPEVAVLVDDCRPAAVICTRDLHGRLPADVGTRSLVVVVDDDAPYVGGGSGGTPVAAGTVGEPVRFEALLAEAPLPHAGPVELDPDTCGWLFYTSGTTGRLKGAMLSHRNLIAMVGHFLLDIDPCAPGLRVLHCAPLTHGGGLYALPCMVRGATQVVAHAPRFEPDRVWADIASGDVQAVAFTAPTMVRQIAAAAAGATVPEGFRFIVYGGAPIAAADLRGCIDVFGASLFQIYGQGEAPMSLTTLSGAAHVAARLADDEEALVSAGHPFTLARVAVLDPDTGAELPAGGIGVIATRGDVVMLGYFEQPDATAEALVDGWLRTGDIGFRDADGRITLLDREKDVIISGGSNIYPREVEEVLVTHEGVSDAIVVGAPDERWGETVVAVIVPTPAWRERREDLERELLALCAERLADYKKPRRVDWLDELPVSAYGKPLRRELRQRYWGDQTRRI
jgi:long-chain acyl-CoA synthetase